MEQLALALVGEYNPAAQHMTCAAGSEQWLTQLAHIGVLVAVEAPMKGVKVKVAVMHGRGNEMGGGGVREGGGSEGGWDGVGEVGSDRGRGMGGGGMRGKGSEGKRRVRVNGMRRNPSLTALVCLPPV